MQKRFLASAALALLLVGCGDTRSALGPSDVETPSARTVMPACDVSWADSVDGDWEDPANWDRGTIPTSSDVVCILTPGSYMVTVKRGEASRVYLSASLTVEPNLAIPGQPLAGRVLPFAPSLEAGALIMDLGWMDFQPGSRVVLDRLEVDGTLLLGGTHDIDVVAVNRNGIVALRDAVLRGVRSFLLEGGLITSSGRQGEVHLSDETGTTVRFEDGAAVWGAGGRVHFIASPGTLPSVIWNDAWLHTGTVTDSVLVFVQGASLSLTGGESNLGDIEIDPAGDSIDLSGTIGSQVTVHVNRADSGGTAPVTLRDLQNDGHLALGASSGGVVHLTGSLINEGLTSVGVGRAELSLDSLLNAGTLVTVDSMRLTRGRLRNMGLIQVTKAASDLVIAGPASFIAQPTGSIEGTISLENGGTLGGTGTLDRVVSIGGTLAPGASAGLPGALVLSELTLDPSSTVIVDAGGTTAGAYDRIHATDRLALGGTLETRTIVPFFAGVCGQVLYPITIDRSRTLENAFTSFSGTDIDATHRWRVHNSQWALELIGHDPTTLVSQAPSAVASREGGPGTKVDLCLAGTRDPTADVVVSAVSRLGQTTILPNSVTFPASDWVYPRRITVSAIDDAIAEPVRFDSIQFSLTSADAGYTGVARQQLAHSIVDDDPGPDLAVANTGGPLVVNVNQQFEGSFSVTNNGPGTSSGATFTVTPMTGLTYVSNGTGASCSPTTGVLTCTIGALAQGGVVQFTILFRATVAGVHANDVSITGNEQDPLPANDSVLYTVTVN